MRTHWVFNDCDEQDRTEVQTYWESKRPRLAKLLENYQPDLRDLRITLYGLTQPRRCKVHAVLHLPTASLVAEDVSSSYTAALDKVVDMLGREITRHKERLQQSHR